MITVIFKSSRKGAEFSCVGATDNAFLSGATSILSRTLFERMEHLEKLDVVELTDVRVIPNEVRFAATLLFPDYAQLLSSDIGFVKAGFRLLAAEHPDEIKVENYHAV